MVLRVAEMGGVPVGVLVSAQFPSRAFGSCPVWYRSAKQATGRCVWCWLERGSRSSVREPFGASGSAPDAFGSEVHEIYPGTFAAMRVGRVSMSCRLGWTSLGVMSLSFAVMGMRRSAAR